MPISYNLFKLIRPHHWIKNIVVILPVIFGMQMGSVQAWLQATVAAGVFCLASSGMYILNDIFDRKNDRQHPVKRKRPIAAGDITVGHAWGWATILTISALVIALVLSRGVFIVTVGFLLLQIAYTTVFKHAVLLDVICIALGFVLRAVCGAVAIGVEISPWLFICMFTLCLFMGFCKRYSEVKMFADVEAARNHRATLLDYTPELLTHLITLSAGIAIMAFLAYSLNVRTIEQFGTSYFVYSLPLVVYAVFRFAMLSMNGAYQDPTDLILHDRLFQFSIVLWMLMIFFIIQFGPALQDWLHCE
ncbi:MAG: decaprenyl-phosphate phosphoribosyltransferase [Sedimentisphaerales bacterium]|nr:decaprenyl-phosphate phosphoribosyltransferase [Sedimentisphaerales bacterium]